MNSENLKIVLCRSPDSGFGDHISCLLGSWLYALRTNRKLLIDWRFSNYSQNQESLFLNCFERIEKLSTVEVQIIEKRINIEGEIFPTKWNKKNIGYAEHQNNSRKGIYYNETLLLKGEDRPESIVVFDHAFSFEREPACIVTDFAPILKSLRFKERILKKSNEYLEKELSRNEILIGIHLRHGNGENVFNRCAYWLSPFGLIRQLFINSKYNIRLGDNHALKSLISEYSGCKEEQRVFNIIDQKVKKIIEKTNKKYKVFLMTDSLRVEKKFKEKIENSFFVEKLYKPDSKGALHRNIASNGNKKKILEDVLIELAILRQSEFIIYMPSQLSFFARAQLEPSKSIEIKPSLINRLIASLYRKIMFLRNYIV